MFGNEALRSATAVEEILEMGGTGSYPTSASARHAVVTWSLLVTSHIGDHLGQLMSYQGELLLLWLVFLF